MNTTLDAPAPPPVADALPNDGEKDVLVYLEIRIDHGISIAKNHIMPKDNYIGGMALNEAIRGQMAATGIKPESFDGAGPVNAYCATATIPRSQAVPFMGGLRELLERLFIGRNAMIQWQADRESLFRIFHHGQDLGLPEQLSYDEIQFRQRARTERLRMVQHALDHETKAFVAIAAALESRAALEKLDPSPPAPLLPPSPAQPSDAPPAEPGNAS